MATLEVTNAGIVLDQTFHAFGTGLPDYVPYVFGQPGIALMSDGSVLVGVQYWIDGDPFAHDTSSFHRAYKLSADGVVTGYLDIPMPNPDTSGCIAVATTGNNVWLGRGSSFGGGPFISTGQGVGWMLDCSGDTPVITNTFDFSSMRTIIGDAFSDGRSIRYLPKLHKIALLCEAGQPSFGTVIGIFDGTTGELDSFLRLYLHGFGLAGVAMNPEGTGRICAIVTSHDVAHPQRIYDLIYLDLNGADGGLQIVDTKYIEDVAGADGGFVLSAITPYQSAAYWLDDTEESIAPHNFIDYFATHPYTPDVLGSTSARFTSASASFKDDSFVRAARTNFLLSSGRLSEDGTEFISAELQLWDLAFAADGVTPAHEYAILPIPDVVDPEFANGFAAGSAALAYDPSTGKFAASYNWLSARPGATEGVQTLVVYLVTGPPDPEPYVRAVQRNDGNGALSNARLSEGLGVPNSATSVQRSAAPRIAGTNNTYA